MESSILAPTVSQLPNFHNLALFICHLFINGNFHTSHIMSDPIMFDDQFMTQLDSVCPQSIPLKLTDLSSPILNPIDNATDNHDNVLQLLFFDPKSLEKYFECCSAHFSYYRIFVFSTTNDMEIKEQFSLIKALNPVYASGTLILYYETLSDEIFINWMPMNDLDGGEWRPTPISISPESTTYEQTFGQYHRKRPIAINLICVEVK